jgi:hypothetical protein
MNEDLGHWLKTYFLDIFCGILFWGALFLCFVQGGYYYKQRMMGQLYLMIGVGVVLVGLAIFLLFSIHRKKHP